MELKDALTIQEEGIKLIRGQRGGYGWEIKTNDLDVEKLKEIDTKLRNIFQGDAAMMEIKGGDI